jgi:hypothetical protein
MPAAGGRNGSGEDGELENWPEVNAMDLFAAVVVVGDKAKVRY